MLYLCDDRHSWVKVSATHSNGVNPSPLTLNSEKKYEKKKMNKFFKVTKSEDWDYGLCICEDFVRAEHPANLIRVFAEHLKGGESSKLVTGGQIRL